MTEILIINRRRLQEVISTCELPRCPVSGEIVTVKGTPEDGRFKVFEVEWYYEKRPNHDPIIRGMLFVDKLPDK